MAADFPYSLSNGRVADIFGSIQAAGTPPKFTNEFLKTTLGYSSSNDRAIISILRKLGFISATGEPTQRYNDFKGHAGGRAIADGLREGWAELFMSNRQIHLASGQEVAKRVASITGANEKTSQRVANTFTKLCELAEWIDDESEVQPPDESTPSISSSNPTHSAPIAAPTQQTNTALRLHHDIHIHLPATSDASVYRAVFQAIKSELT